MERPDYDAMVASYERGELDAIICWDLDRLTRQPSQLEEWIERAEEHGLKLVTANGDADLSTDGGRMFVRIRAAVARGEVERKGARQSRAQQQRAEQGRWCSGGVRPIGATAQQVKSSLLRRRLYLVSIVLSNAVIPCAI